LRLDVEYFSSDLSSGDPTNRPLTLAVAADVFIQMATLVHLAPTVTYPARALAMSGRGNPFSQHELVSVSSGSLLLGILLPAGTITSAGLGLLMLSERIATYKVRVLRKWREEMLKADELDSKRRAIRAARADALATQLRRASGVRPSKMTFSDPDDPTAALEDLSPSSDFALSDWDDD
jgi:hypothetical protein